MKLQILTITTFTTFYTLVVSDTHIIDCPQVQPESFGGGAVAAASPQTSSARALPQVNDLPALGAMHKHDDQAVCN